ncbi:unnamed protein product [Pleuronectes platessa]|uniref:Uncharacterized protein n=1 Tax=Pleuronectes platessa TaxID=8262 RepID=A0A9N7UIV0_PLEPL|nr:unnamed protein product [Pleuronectes platessa]
MLQLKLQILQKSLPTQTLLSGIQQLGDQIRQISHQVMMLLPEVQSLQSYWDQSEVQIRQIIHQVRTFLPEEQSLQFYWGQTEFEKRVFGVQSLQTLLQVKNFQSVERAEGLNLQLKRTSLWLVYPWLQTLMGALLEEQFPVEVREAWFAEASAEDLILQTLLINFDQVIPVGEVVELHLEDGIEAQTQF